MKYIIKYREQGPGVIQYTESNKSDLHDDVISLWKDGYDIVNVSPNDFDWSLINKPNPDNPNGTIFLLPKLADEL